MRACRVIFIHMKEGAGGSQWEGKDGVVVLYIYIFQRKGPAKLVGGKMGYDPVCVKRRKWPAGAGRCEDGV